MYYVKKTLLCFICGALVIFPLTGCYQYTVGIQKTYDIAVEKKFDFPITYRAKEIRNSEEDTSRNTMAPTVYIEPSTLVYYNEYY